MSGWKTIKIGDCTATNINYISKEYSHKEILYLDTGSITCNKVEQLQSFSLTQAPSRAKRLVREDDIIYSTVRPNQLHFGYVKTPPENLVVSTGFVVITCDQTKIFPKYLYYYLTQKQSTEYLHSIAEASTTAYPSLKPTDIEALEIDLPPLPEQKAIAGVLSSLDDKIDLLQRQNKTLEAMAETLFRQWFIEEAEDDWKTCKLSDISVIKIGRTPPRKEKEWFSYNPEDVKWISIKDLGNSGLYILDTAEKLTPEAVDRFSVPIIPSNTLVLSFKMTVGRVAITTEEMLSNEAIAQFQLINDLIATEYLYLFLKQYKYENLGSTSSIVTAINSAMIRDIDIMIPNERKVREFSQIIRALFEKIKTNQKQIISLQNLRDTLLPKLMVGEVRIQI